MVPRGRAILVFIFLIGYLLQNDAHKRCISNQKDNKTVPFYPVHCYCPCARYPKAAKRNMCLKCGHAIVPTNSFLSFD